MAVSNTSCSFEMLSVILPPLSLVQDDKILARIRAGNNIGWGTYSMSNTDGQITQKQPSISS